MLAQNVNTIYYFQTCLKVLFIFMAIFNLPYTVIVGFLASLCGLLRIVKDPQLSREYLQKALMNPHGQNILYIGMGCMGQTNFLFFAPLILYFFYALAEFYNQKMPGAISPKVKDFVDQIRNHRWTFMESKSRLEIIYFVYLLITIPIDFSRILRCLLMAQFNLLKFRASQQTQYAAKAINSFIVSKISGIGFLLNAYNKIIDYVYKFATQQEPAPAA